MTQQISLQLAVAEDRHAALQRHALLSNATTREQQNLVSVYFDTGRHALRRAGIILCLRRQGTAWIQIIKRREESQVGLMTSSEWQAPYLNHFDFTHIEDDEFREWLLREKIARNVASVFEIKFRRTSWLLEPAPGVSILAKLDRGWIASNGRRAEISELGLELRAGQIDAIYAVALDLGCTQALPPTLLSKSDRGYRLLRDSPHLPLRAREIDIRLATSPIVAFRLIALDCIKHLQSNHLGALRGEDPEFVHQMRVATRRFRAALRMFRPALPATMEETLTPPLRELSRSLGEARDLDVLIWEIVDPVSRAIPDEPRVTELASAIVNRQYVARSRIEHVLRQPGYGRLLLNAGRQLHNAISADTPQMTGENSSLKSFADRRLRKLLHRIQELADIARADYPPSLHDLRIAIKRLRYGIEFFGSIIPKKSAQAVIKRLAKLQDELGQINDLSSAGSLLMVCAGRDQHLREAVTLIGGWHGRRHAALLDAIPARLNEIRSLKLPKIDY